MKSKRIFLNLILGLAMYLLFPTIIHASDFALIQCKYTTKYMTDDAASFGFIQNGGTYDIELVYSDYEASSSITDSKFYGPLGLYRIYYNEDNALMIGPSRFLANNRYGDSGYYGNIGRTSFTKNYWEDRSEYDNAATESFKRALDERDRCPQYLYLQEISSGSDKIATVNFTNTRPEMCSSTYDTNEPCHILLEGNTVFSSKIDEQKTWEFQTNCAEEGIGANISIFVKNKQLRYNSVNKTTSDYIATSDMTSDMIHDVTILGVYNLENGIPFEIGYNPNEKGSEKGWKNGVCFPDETNTVSCGKTYCSLISKTEVKYNCTTYDKIEADIEAKKAAALDAVSKARLNRKFLEHVSAPNNSGVVLYNAFTKEYYLTKDIHELVTISTQLKGAIAELNKSSDIVKEYLDFISNNRKDICNAFQNKLDGHSVTENESAKEIQDIISKISLEAKTIKEVLIEKGATDAQLAQSDSTIEAYEEAEQRAGQLVNLSNQNIILNKDFNIGNVANYECGLLSPDMIKILNTLLWYVRIIGVVLAVILSILDYIKAAAGADDKSLPAANKKFVTRMILVAVLFLLPVLLDTLLSVYNPTTAESIKCLTK